MFDSVISDLDQHLKEGRALLAQIKAEPYPHYANIVVPFNAFEDALHRFWAPISHLHSVKNSPELREIYQIGIQKLTDFNTEVAQDEALFHCYEKIAASKDFNTLDFAQKKVIEHALRDFKLSGVALPSKQKLELKQIEAALSQLSTRFEQNLMDAIDAWSYHTEDSTVLAGIPVHLLDQGRAKAAEKGLSGFLLGLDAPTYAIVMSYAKDRALRAHFYEAFVTRASDLGDPAFDNSETMLNILKCRQKQAHLLGFSNYAEYALQGKMAPSIESVMMFLEDLAKRIRPQGVRELAEVQAFADAFHPREPGDPGLASYDIPYYSERLKESRFGFSEEDLRPFFPISKVLTNLFSVLSQVFGLSLKKVKKDAWHADVEYFDVYNEQGTLCGSIYMDLYAREKKRSGAWMDECQGRYFTNKKKQTPIAYLTANFLRGSGGEAHLTHDDIITLFHEMGHVLQHVLTQVNEPGVAGILGVPWDAVEFPSQFMEHFAWQREMLESLPVDLYEKLLGSRYFHGALQMLRQLEFSIFDLSLHEQDAKTLHSYADVMTILDRVRKQVSVIEVPAYNRFPHSFSHIFAGGYAAAYYSYKWAEVLSCDAFSRFEEEGIFNRELGRSFCETILESGGAVDAMDLFIRFRGREPKIDALLKNAGIEEKK